MLRAPITADPGLVAPSARDEFNQTAGALHGKALPAGGTWDTNDGDATDASVETTGKTAQRTATNDSPDWYAIAGTSTHAAVAVRVDFKASNDSPAGFIQGVLARYTDPNNYLRAIVTRGASPPHKLTLQSIVAGVTDQRADVLLPSELAAGVWYSIAVQADAAGRALLWFGLQDRLKIQMAMSSTALATGGTLDDGKVGFQDANTQATACTRNYDNFTAWVPVTDAVLHANQSAELRWDGMYREDSTGTAYGPVSWVTGDLPRLPPTVEGSTTEIFLKPSRGDFDQLPDDGIDDKSARVYYRPCWLTIPGE